MRLPGGGHLSYCTNVHPGESWAETFAALHTHIPAVKRLVCPAAPFGIGLRLSAAAARGLESENALRAFARWLAAEDCYVFTLNGFPYGAFHRTRVKEAVFAPDWTSPARCGYTRRLARLLAALLPEGTAGSISTLPLGYRPDFSGPGRAARLARCARHLAGLALFLAGLESSCGRRIGLGLEPEPDGAIESVAEWLQFFQGHLLPAARREGGEEAVRRHLGICLDTCHASVVGEAPAELLPALARAGSAMVKLQVSAALEADWPAGDAQALRERLAGLDEPVYLHQVRVLGRDGSRAAYPDLGPALAAGPAGEWRIHFHVPIDLPACAGLSSTQADTAALLADCRAAGYDGHFEIETYTWEVLPIAGRTDLDRSIAGELSWALARLAA